MRPRVHNRDHRFLERVLWGPVLNLAFESSGFSEGGEYGSKVLLMTGGVDYGIGRCGEDCELYRSDKSIICQ